MSVFSTKDELQKITEKLDKDELIKKAKQLAQQNKQQERSLERILELSVKNQLFADVPVGILLSGGVDSSIITALASKIQKNIKKN